MHYRRLGRTGLKVSEISLGAWLTFGNQIDDDISKSLVQAAFEQGLNFFDNADVYADGQAEVVLGKAIQGLPREELVISSKVFFPTFGGPNGRGLSRKHIRESLQASLRRLGLTYLDIYYCHRFDPDTPVEEVVRTMDALTQQGLIFYWGTSEWEAAQVTQAIGIARQLGMNPPVVEQPQYNLFRRRRVEDELAPLCKEFGLGLTTFSPLFSGILSGKYNEGIPKDSRAGRGDAPWVVDALTPERVTMVKQLTLLAEDLGLTTAQLAIAWILRRKEVSSVITGATHPEQLDENLIAAESIHLLTNDILERMDVIVNGSH